jgi:hypothetical protein
MYGSYNILLHVLAEGSGLLVRRSLSPVCFYAYTAISNNEHCNLPLQVLAENSGFDAQDVVIKLQVGDNFFLFVLCCEPLLAFPCGGGSSLLSFFVLCCDPHLAFPCGGAFLFCLCPCYAAILFGLPLRWCGLSCPVKLLPCLCLYHCVGVLIGGGAFVCIIVWACLSVVVLPIRSSMYHSAGITCVPVMAM